VADEHLPFAAISLSVLPFPKNDMVESVGKRLNRARLERHITVEEASHATKMRAERVLDLENDDYTNFPSLAYAKGFLVIYAKYLGVDVSDFSSNLNVSGRFGIEDYEYLHNAPEPLPPIVREKPRRSVKPLVIVIIAVVGTVAAMNFMSKFERLGNIDELLEKQGDPKEASQAQGAPSPTPAKLPAGPNAQKPPPATTPPATTRPDAVAATPVPAPLVDDDKALVDGSIQIRRAEPVTPAPAAGAPPAAQTPTPVPRASEIALQPLKKTWVKIRAAGQTTPIFEDWLYPDAPALKFRGAKLWIELGDRDGVQIIRNGEPVPYQDPGVAVE
jgi:cytoskeletal protein RodZ